ncbi:MAG: hypothetical protein J6K98_01975 [Clostridia bacterium]|nr:hypothetical protein [Clostridia bacterium]
MKRAGLLKEAVLFMVGGLGYNLIELGWRGRTHWSMTLLGGICFHMIGRIFLRLGHRTRVGCCALSALAVTAAEFLSGCLVNRLFRLDVWDYSLLPGNLLGQVCVGYSCLWALLSLPAAWFYRVLRHCLKA